MKNLFPVEFVSLGPGEADLITLKGCKSLQMADVIFCPETVMGNRRSSRALDILRELGIDEEKVCLFTVPMQKVREETLVIYKEVAGRIGDARKVGKRVAVVAEGDTGFYSSVHYISGYLKEHAVPVAYIAGVPAFIACGARAGIHIVKQEEPLVVIPGIVTGAELSEKIKQGATLVIMKASQCQEAIKECVAVMDSVNFHYFENTGIPDKEFYTTCKAEILSRTFPYFSLLIIRN